MIREICPDGLFICNAMDPRDMIYCRLPMIDGDGKTEALIETAIQRVVMLVQNESRRMVACSAGMSRFLWPRVKSAYNKMVHD